MGTIEKLISQTRAHANGRESYSVLSTALTSVTLTHVHTEADTGQARPSPGDIIGIGLEDMFVTHVHAPVTETVQVHVIRGFNGTTAVTHAVDSQITVGANTDSKVLDALNSALSSLPSEGVIAVEAETITPSPPLVRYPLSGTDVRSILMVQEKIGSYWSPVRSFKFEAGEDPTAFPGGVALVVPDVVGTSMRVTYGYKPTALTATTGDFAALTGLNAVDERLVASTAAFDLASAIKDQDEITQRGLGNLGAIRRGHLNDSIRRINETYPHRRPQ